MIEVVPEPDPPREFGQITLAMPADQLFESQSYELTLGTDPGERKSLSHELVIKHDVGSHGSGHSG